MTTILKPDDLRIVAYRHLHGTPTLHTENGIFIAEGTKTVRALLKSELEILSIFALPEFYQEYSALISSRNLQPEQLFTADKSVMNLIVGFRLHEGIMAIGKQPNNLSINELKFPAVMFCGIVNSENVGAIVRNCAAFGAKSIIIDRETSSPYLRRAVRVSMGAVFGIGVHYAADSTQTLTALRRDFGCSIICAEMSANSVPLESFTFSERSVIIFGSEGKGVPPPILAASDAIVSISISNGIDSLNVAAASAVILHQLYRQCKIV